MKKTLSQTSSGAQKNDSLSMERDQNNIKPLHTKTLNIAPLNLTGLSSTSGNQSDSAMEMSNPKQSKGSSSSQNFEKYYMKLSNSIKEIYLDIKHKTVEENQNLFLVLKKSIPFEEDDDKSITTDPGILLQYIKQIFDKNYEFKVDAERELAAKKESECSDYEAMLQKLEAEVRQHIRIEQQLKLYVESTQAKLDDYEKANDPNKLESLKKEVEEARSETFGLQEKLKKRETEIESFKKDIRLKMEMLQNLEAQVETIPTLKNKIRDLEKALAQEQSRPSTSTLKSHNSQTVKEPRESESNYSKTVNISNNLAYENSKSRKSSQPVVGLQTAEISKYKYEKERNKENIEIVKLDASSNRDLKYKENVMSEKEKSRETIRPDSGKSFIRYDDRMEEFAMMQNKMKKAGRSDSSRNLSKDKYRESEYELVDDRYSNARSYSQKVQNPSTVLTSKITGDMIEPSKFSTDKIVKPSYKEDISDRRQSDKIDYKTTKTKSDNQLKSSKPSSNDYDSADVNSNPYLNKNYIPKPRSGTGYDSTGNITDTSKYRKDDTKDLSKLKVNSPKKVFQDRSHSVDATHKFYRQSKEKSTTYDRPNEDYMKGAPIEQQYKYSNGFNATQNLSGVFKPGHY